MTIRAEVLDALLAAGATAEMIVAAVKADARQEEAKLQERREKDAARQQKSRANRKSRMSQDVTVTPRDECDPSPNDIYSNPLPANPVEANASTPPLSERVVTAWNEMAAANGLRTSRKLNHTRLKHLAARVKQHGEDAVFEAIRAVALSDWHCGRKAGSDWKANLGWLLESPEKFDRLLEIGDEAKAGNPTAKPTIDMDEYRARMARLDQRGFTGDARLADAQAPPRQGKPVTLGDILQRQAGSA